MGALSLSSGTFLILQGPAWATGRPEATKAAEPRVLLPIPAPPTTAAGMQDPKPQIRPPGCVGPSQTSLLRSSVQADSPVSLPRQDDVFLVYRPSTWYTTAIRQEKEIKGIQTGKEEVEMVSVCR